MLTSSNGCIEGIVQRLKTYKDPALVHEIKVNFSQFNCAITRIDVSNIQLLSNLRSMLRFVLLQFYDMRILFVLTALLSDVRYVPGATRMFKYSDQIFSMMLGIWY